jgi:hypothetical protein
MCNARHSPAKFISLILDPTLTLTAKLLLLYTQNGHGLYKWVCLLVQPSPFSNP